MGNYKVKNHLRSRVRQQAIKRPTQKKPQVKRLNTLRKPNGKVATVIKTLGKMNRLSLPSIRGLTSKKVIKDLNTPFALHRLISDGILLANNKAILDPFKYTKEKLTASFQSTLAKIRPAQGGIKINITSKIPESEINDILSDRKLEQRGKPFWMSSGEPLLVDYEKNKLGLISFNIFIRNVVVHVNVKDKIDVVIEPAKTMKILGNTIYLDLKNNSGYNVNIK